MIWEGEKAAALWILKGRIMVHDLKELEAPSEDASNQSWQGFIYFNERIW